MSSSGDAQPAPEETRTHADDADATSETRPATDAAAAADGAAASGGGSAGGGSAGGSAGGSESESDAGSGSDSDAGPIPLCAAAPARKRRKIAATASGVEMTASDRFRREDAKCGARLAARAARDLSPLRDPVPEHERAGVEMRDRFGGYDGFTIPMRPAQG